jgi:hypothetical protein
MMWFLDEEQQWNSNMLFKVQYRKSGNFGHGFILAPKCEVPKLNTPKYVTLQKLTAKIEHCLNIFL